MRRAVLSGLLAALGALTGFQIQLLAESATAPPFVGLTVSVISGRNAANVLRPALVVPPIVEVHDGQNRPVIGAIVKFTSPLQGATITFIDGGHSRSVVTDLSRRAAVDAIAPSGVGTFNIAIAAAYDGQHAETVISQSNFPTLRAAQPTGASVEAHLVQVANTSALSTPVKAGLLAGGVAVLAAAAIYFATRGHKSSISAGPPTVGPPH